MKIAMLLSGIARNIEEGHNNLSDKLILPNNPDIFIHAWNNPDEPQNYDLINKLYCPKSIVMEDRKSFKDASMNLDRIMSSHAIYFERNAFLDTTYSMWYSIQQANLLKEQYKLNNDIYYDYVIRARFDLVFNMKIECQKYDPNVIHIVSRGLPSGMVDDRFAFGANDLMNIYCGGFNNLTRIYNIKDKIDGIFCGECILHETLNRWNIPYKPIDGAIGFHLNHR
jgi:hypothetical protein